MRSLWSAKSCVHISGAVFTLVSYFLNVLLVFKFWAVVTLPFVTNTSCMHSHILCISSNKYFLDDTRAALTTAPMHMN